MKILIVSNTDWYLFRFRLSLARFLRANGEEVVLASPPGAYASQIEADGFRWLSWEVGRQSVNPLKEAQAVWRLHRIVSQEKPDLVHLHTIKPVLYGSLAAWAWKHVALVRSITGRGYVFLGEDFRARLLRPLVKFVYRLALGYGRGMTIFENETDRSYFVDEKLVGKDRTCIIEGVGVDTDFYSPLPEPEGSPVVVLAGRMLWDKGVGTFVEAARLLRSKASARFVLVGQPDVGNPASIEVEMLKRWVEEGVVEWWGWKSDMCAVFSDCHVVALPSLGEGLPTILLEAASSGRPIVATDVPGCRDVVANGINGLIVPPQNPLALAEAMEKLIVHPDMRRSMGQAGRDLVVGRFSSAKINQSTYEVYQRLVNEIGRKIRANEI
jgi:glycosyltransferase involved in cell wall biosynthesis